MRQAPRVLLAAARRSRHGQLLTEPASCKTDTSPWIFHQRQVTCHASHSGCEAVCSAANAWCLPLSSHGWQCASFAGEQRGSQLSRQFATRPQRTTRAQRSEGTTSPETPKAAEAKASQAAETDEPTEAELEDLEALRRMWQVDEPFRDLDEGHVNMFWDFAPHQHLIPEAFHDYYVEASKRGETVYDRGGCKGLQAEMEEGKDGRLMVRQQALQLRDAIIEGKQKQHFLDGPTGGGKSVTLATLAAWGRDTGRIVVYIPSASILTAGGYYHKNEASGMWHTPDSAKLLMRSVQAQHQEQLSQLEGPRGQGTLDDVITEGLTSTDDNAATDAAVALLQGLRDQTQEKVLFVVDDWNSLYWPTGYFEWQSVHKQYNVLPIELQLCMAVRSLIEEAPPVNGSVVVATTHSKGISTHIVMPRPRRSRNSNRFGNAHFEIPAFDLDETFAWLRHLAANDVIPSGDPHWEEADFRQLFQQWLLAWHLTGGNPVAMRQHLAPLFHC